MKRIIMLTSLCICGILLLVGCENGSFYVENKEDDYYTQRTEKQENVSFEHFEEPKKEVYNYNESGKILIVMYHRFAKQETDEWTRSFENFYKDLEYLYEHGYRTISLNDYINNDIKVPVGCTPIVLTFDDGSKGQFNLVRDENGSLIANPESAVGIMERFYAEYPEFGLNGTFYINQTGYFSGEGTREERLQYLIDRGFEVGNHTSTHINLSNASIDEIQKEVGVGVKNVRELVDYEMTSLALPYGINSKEYKEYVIAGEYDGTSYNNKAILLVGAGPALSPNNENVNLLKLPRVRARGGNKAVECDLYWWLEKMEENPETKYYRLED